MVSTKNSYFPGGFCICFAFVSCVAYICSFSVWEKLTVGSCPGLFMVSHVMLVSGGENSLGCIVRHALPILLMRLEWLIWFLLCCTFASMIGMVALWASSCMRLRCWIVYFVMLFSIFAVFLGLFVDCLLFLLWLRIFVLFSF